MAGTLGDYMTQRMLKNVYKELNLSKAQLVTVWTKCPGVVLTLSQVTVNGCINLCN
jgi:hypothetical protein